MKNIFIPSSSPDDWQKLLADPCKQWRKGYSARTLAYCWQEANGFPTSIIKAFRNSGIELFNDVKLLCAFPEWKVNLPGGKRASQNDIYVIAKCKEQLMSIMVEGKVNEPFDKTILEWDQNSSRGKRERLDFLLKLLNIDKTEVDHIRYQLLHRAASAVIEATKITARNAMILVHSFSEQYEWFDDFKDFVDLFGLTAIKDSIVGPTKIGETDLYFGWVKGEKKYLYK